MPIVMRNVTAVIALLFLAVYLFLFVFVCFLTASFWRYKDAYISHRWFTSVMLRRYIFVSITAKCSMFDVFGDVFRHFLN